MNVWGVTFGGYLTKILSFKTGNLLNNSKFHLLSEGTVPGPLATPLSAPLKATNYLLEFRLLRKPIVQSKA